MEIVGDKIAMWFEKGMWHFTNEKGEEIAHNAFDFRGEGIDFAGISLSRKVILAPFGEDAVLVCSNKGNQATCWTRHFISSSLSSHEQEAIREIRRSVGLD